jgi:L-alanine-DL-glutamate epimerase-like enolase superfamily enzyme
MDSGDPSGKLNDFIRSLSIVVDQFDKQRRRANWHEAGYKAGKQKVVDYAVEKALATVCCKGEPHTCEQEAIAAAEGRTDRLIEQLSACRSALAEACEIAVDAAVTAEHHFDHETALARIAELRKAATP